MGREGNHRDAVESLVMERLGSGEMSSWAAGTSGGGTPG